MEIPDFLIEMSKQMNEQDNRITADPIWMVCYDKKHITDEGYEDFIEYVDSRNDYNIIYSTEEGTLATEDYAKAELIEGDPEFCAQWIQWQQDDGFEDCEDFEDFDVGHEFLYDNRPEGIEAFYMVRRQEVVKACLTEADANWFIQRKQHDYPKLYTYVFSMCFCPQMIELRNWILSLTKGN